MEWGTASYVPSPKGLSVKRHGGGSRGSIQSTEVSEIDRYFWDGKGRVGYRRDTQRASTVLIIVYFKKIVF